MLESCEDRGNRRSLLDIRPRGKFVHSRGAHAGERERAAGGVVPLLQHHWIVRSSEATSFSRRASSRIASARRMKGASTMRPFTVKAPTPREFFENGQGARTPVEGTVPLGYEAPAGDAVATSRLRLV